LNVREFYEKFQKNVSVIKNIGNFAKNTEQV